MHTARWIEDRPGEKEDDRETYIAIHQKRKGVNATMVEVIRRPDSGPRYAEYETRCLRWIGEQGGAQFGQVQKLLARLSPTPQKLLVPHLLSVQRTRKKKDKWRREGLIEYRIFLANEKGWLWLSRKGMEFAGLGDLRHYEPRLESLRHLYYVNQARLYVEYQRPGDLWKSERIIRYEQPAAPVGKKAPHIPDALFVKPNGDAIAIEVELTLKKRERIVEILKELATTYQRTWYFASEAVGATVAAALAQLPEHQRKSIQILALEQKLG
jgi:hypothetical protein